MSSFLNLGWVEMDILQHLERMGPCNASEIGASLGWPSNMVETALDTLLRSGKIRSAVAERESVFESV